MLVWTYEEGTWDGRVYSSVADVSWVLAGPPPPRPDPPAIFAGSLPRFFPALDYIRRCADEGRAD